MKMHASYRMKPATRLSLWIAALILICQALCFSNASAQVLDYYDTTFTRLMNASYWERNLPSNGVTIDSGFPGSEPGLARSITVHRPVTFSRSTFDSTVSFLLAVFDSTAHFVGTCFRSRGCFSGVTFCSDVFFTDAEFKSVADFYGMSAESSALFERATFAA